MPSKISGETGNEYISLRVTGFHIPLWLLLACYLPLWLGLSYWISRSKLRRIAATLPNSGAAAV